MANQIKYIHSFDNEPLYTEIFQNSKNNKYDFVVLHGLGGDSNATLLLIESLLKKIPHLRCITYDLRGHGYSSKKWPAKENNLETVGAKDLAFICDFFKIKKPIFICHSLSSIILQEYILQKCQPFPQYSFLMSAPLKIAPISISRKFWFKIYKKTNFLFKTHKKRSLKHHLKNKDTFDLSLYRIIDDIRHMGLINFLLMYFSLFGWKNDNLESLNKNNVFFCCGSKDILLIEKKQRQLLIDVKNIQIKSFNSNHHQIFTNNYEEVSDLVKSVI